MREVPRIADVLRVHIWSPIMAVGMLSILYFAGQYLGDWKTVAKINMLFWSAPDMQGGWLVIPWAIAVGAGHALFFGTMLKEMYGRDDIYRHFMGKGHPLVGVTNWAAERVLALDVLEGLLTVTSRLAFCIGVPVTVCAFFTGDAHVSTMIIFALVAGSLLTIVHSKGTPLSLLSTFLWGIGFLIAADVFGFATAFLLAFTLEVFQAMSWYVGKRIFWLNRRLHEESKMGRSRIRLVLQSGKQLLLCGMELMYILRLRRRPPNQMQQLLALMAQEQEAKQRG